MIKFRKWRFLSNRNRQIHLKNRNRQFRQKNRALNKEKEADFLKFAQERGMVGVKGHRSVGGFRASCYNALPKESVQALIDCMKEFERTI